MQDNKEKKSEKMIERRPKSNTRFPKQMPTYVVAFAVDETHNDQMITSHPSIQRRTSSHGSISTTSSTNTFTVFDDTQEISSIIDAPESNKEIKINVEEDALVDKASLETTIYLIDDNPDEEDPNKQPQVLFDSTKINRHKMQRKRSKNHNGTVKIRTINFKNKGSKLTKKIQKYYVDKHIASAQIQKDLCSECISKVVSRCSVVKNALAKENLLEAVNQEIMAEETEEHRIESESIKSSASTAVASKYSFSSANTLVCKKSSMNDDFYSIGDSIGANSSQIDTRKVNGTAYNSPVINVALAVTHMGNNQHVSDMKNEKFMYEESLTSTGSPTRFSVPLTSKPPTTDTSKIESSKMSKPSTSELLTAVSLVKYSNTTLTLPERDSISDVSSDKFVIARTSSDFNRVSPTDGSTYVISSSNSVSKLRRNNLPVSPHFIKNPMTNSKNTLHDSLDSWSTYRVDTPSPASSHSPNEFNDNYNDVIVTENKTVTIPIEKNKEAPNPIPNANIFVKNFLIENTGVLPQKNINLPNEAAMKAMMTNEKPKMTCNQESRTSPSPNLTEVWDKLTTVVDVIVQRLEESLADKIIREIKSASKSQYTNSINLDVINVAKTKSFGIDYRSMAEKEVLAKQKSQIDEDKSFQCSLVDNDVIDSLMQRLSMEGPKYLIQTSSPIAEKVKEPELLKDYFEVLKAPVIKAGLKEDFIGIDDTITTSTYAAGVTGGKLHKFHVLRSILAVPFAFLRENIIIITAIPTFFVFLFLMYFVIALLVKIW